MRFLIAMAALLITLAAAQAQTVISGNGNGNGNSGTGSGNGNGNGNGNGIVTVMNSARGNTPSFAAPGLVHGNRPLHGQPRARRKPNLTTSRCEPKQIS